jgi:hypothetical protein
MPFLICGTIHSYWMPLSPAFKITFGSDNPPQVSNFLFIVLGSYFSNKHMINTIVYSELNGRTVMVVMQIDNKSSRFVFSWVSQRQLVQTMAAG